MIVTDHHGLGQETPDAVAILNPKRPDSDYPEKMLAGVGIAYKLAQALYGEEGYSTIERVGARPTLDVNGLWGGFIGEGANPSAILDFIGSGYEHRKNRSETMSLNIKADGPLYLLTTDINGDSKATS